MISTSDFERIKAYLNGAIAYLAETPPNIAGASGAIGYVVGALEDLRHEAMNQKQSDNQPTNG